MKARVTSKWATNIAKGNDRTRERLKRTMPELFSDLVWCHPCLVRMLPRDVESHQRRVHGAKEAC